MGNNIPTISAKIDIELNELKSIIDRYNISNEVTQKDDATLVKNIDIEIFEKRKKHTFSIERRLDSKEYSVIDSEYNTLSVVAKEFVKRLPYILYNDDFIDRPPSTVEIPTEITDELSDWQLIYNRLFEFTDKNYSLPMLLDDEDERIVNSIISDVEDELCNQLSKAWKSFLLGNDESLKIKLNLKKQEKKLTIQVVEKIGNKDRHFDITDRSKGFLWFYNFIMKLKFNPKVIGDEKNTIFLLDEPGSYLHSSAQDKLCSKLSELSKSNGNVIYCTHTHHLLNPNIIPLNCIYIVEKELDKKIIATPSPMMKTSKKNIAAYQPVLEALQIPNYIAYSNNTKVLLVEGIYDKYSIELFCDLENDVAIIPGTNASSIVHNIQFVNGFSIPYAAVWDNDKEGIKEFDNASKLYGDFEAQRFDKLPLLDRTKRKMEDMYENNDIDKIRDALGLPVDVGYEKIISALYFSNSKLKTTIKEQLSKETKELFKILNSIINKKINFSMDEMRDVEFTKEPQ